MSGCNGRRSPEVALRVTSLLGKTHVASGAKRTSASVDRKRLGTAHDFFGPIGGRPTARKSTPPLTSKLLLKGDGRRRGSQGRVVDTGSEGDTPGSFG
jgi:hypothetical protein